MAGSRWYKAVPPRRAQPSEGGASAPLRQRAPHRLRGRLRAGPRCPFGRRKGGSQGPFPCTYSRSSGSPRRPRGRGTRNDGEGPWGESSREGRAPAATRAGNRRLLFPKPGSGQTAPRPPGAPAAPAAALMRPCERGGCPRSAPGRRPGPPFPGAAGAERRPGTHRGPPPAPSGRDLHPWAPLPAGPPRFSPFCAGLRPLYRCGLGSAAAAGGDASLIASPRGYVPSAHSP